MKSFWRKFTGKFFQYFQSNYLDNVENGWNDNCFHGKPKTNNISFCVLIYYKLLKMRGGYKLGKTLWIDCFNNFIKAPVFDDIKINLYKILFLRFLI